MTATFLGRVRDDWMGATGWGRLAWVVFALVSSFCSSSSSTALFQLVLHLPLCTHLSQIALTIAYSSILVFNLCYRPALTVFCALRHALLANYQSSVMEQSVHA